MIKKITSENPDNHWSFLNVKDKIVMDMGCSFWDSTWNEGWLSSSEYFVSKEAKKVIGFDCAKHDIDRYHELYPNHQKYFMFHLCVNKDEHIENLLDDFQPEVIKCDIEGAEIHFQNITKYEINSVKEIGIEYHNEPTREMCIDRFNKWGFKVIDLYQLGNEDIQRVGVYHAKKNII